MGSSDGIALATKQNTNYAAAVKANKDHEIIEPEETLAVTLPLPLPQLIAYPKLPSVKIYYAPTPTAATTPTPSASPPTPVTLSITAMTAAAPGSYWVPQPIESNSTSTPVEKDSIEGLTTVDNLEHGRQTIITTNSTMALEIPIDPAKEQRDTPNKDASTSPATTSASC
jgi:hypothetical protein